MRLYAEDPWDAFRPVGGRRHRLAAPAGPGVRVDTALHANAPLPSAYDPLIAKVLVAAVDRPAAIARLRRALDETVIGGMQTDLGFLRWLVDEPGFAAGDYDTSLIEERWGEGPAARSGGRRPRGRGRRGRARRPSPATGGAGWPAERRDGRGHERRGARRWEARRSTR